MTGASTDGAPGGGLERIGDNSKNSVQEATALEGAFISSQDPVNHLCVPPVVQALSHQNSGRGESVAVGMSVGEPEVATFSLPECEDGQVASPTYNNCADNDYNDEAKVDEGDNTRQLPPCKCAMRTVYKTLMMTDYNFICVTVVGERIQPDIEVEELEDNNDNICFICNTTGEELVCCNNCSNACHEVCLGQTIDSLPDVWHCPPCSTKRGVPHYPLSCEEGGVPCAPSLMPNMDKDVLFEESAVHSLAEESAMHSLAEESADEEDLSNDLCEVCSQGGKLLCCDMCNRVFHLRCVRPKLKEMPPCDWSCVFCWEKGTKENRRDNINHQKAKKEMAAMACREMKRMKVS